MPNTIDSLQIDLTLGIDDFIRKANDAKKTLQNTFNSSVDEAKKLNNELSKIESKWNQGKDFKSIDSLVKGFEKATASSEVLTSKLNELKSAMAASLAGDKSTDIASKFKEIRQVIADNAEQAADTYKTETSRIDAIIEERYRREAELKAEARAATEESIKVEEEGLDRIARQSQYTFEKAEKAKESLLRLESRVPEILEKIEGARQRLQEVSASRDAAYSELGAQRDDRGEWSTKGLSKEAVKSLEAVDTAWNNARKEVTAYEKELTSVQNSIAKKTTEIENKTLSATKTQERLLDAQVKQETKLKAAMQVAAERAAEEERAAERAIKTEQSLQEARQKSADIVRETNRERGTDFAVSIDLTEKYAESVVKQEQAEQELNDLYEKRATILKELSDLTEQLPSSAEGIESKDLSKYTTVIDDINRLNKELTQTDSQIEKAEHSVLKAEENVSKAADKIADSVIKAADKAEKEATDKMKSLDNAIKGLGSSIGSLLATVGATKFIKDAIKNAGELEKATQRITNLFGPLGSEARLAAEEISEAYGMSNKAAAQTLGYVGNLMTAYGLSKRQALDLAEGITTLSADLAAFTGGTSTAEQAAQALSQALLGNYRATRNLGIAITDTEIKMYAKNLGLATDKLSQGELALLRYQAIMDQAKNVTGDFARSQDTFYVATQKANAAIQDMKAAFGEDLLPLLVQGLNAVTAISDWIADWNPAFKGLITGLGIAVATFTLLSTILKPLITNFAILNAHVKASGGLFTKAAIGIGQAKVAADSMTSSQIALNAAMNASPILMIISLFAGFVTAAVGVTGAIKNSVDPMKTLNDRIDSINKSLKEYAERAKVAAEIKLPGIYEPVDTGTVEADIQSIIDTYEKAQNEIARLQEERVLKEKKLQEKATAAAENVAFLGSIGHPQAELWQEKRDKALDDLVKYQEEYKKNMEEQEKIASTAFSSLVHFFGEQPDLIKKAAGSYEGLADQLERTNALYARFVSNGHSVEEVLTAMNYDSEDWDSTLEKLNEDLDKQQIKRLQNEGEYREAVLHTIAALDEESAAYKRNIDSYAQWNKDVIAATLIDRGTSAEEIENVLGKLDDIFSKASEGDTSTLEIDLAEATGLTEESDQMLLNHVKGLVQDLVGHFTWYKTSRLKIENEYADSVYKINEELQSRIKDLTSKSYSTMEEQRDASLQKQKETYQKYIDELYADRGGAKGILGDLATEEELAAFEKALNELKDGMMPFTTNGEDGALYRLFFGDQAAAGEQAQKFFDVITAYYDAFLEGQKNTKEEYQLNLKKQLNQEIDALRESRLNLTDSLTERLQIEKDRLKDQYEMEKIELSRLYSNEKDYQEAVARLDEKYANQKLKLEKDTAEEIYQVRKSLNNRSKDIARETVDYWTSSSVVQEGDFLNPIFTSLYELDKEFDDIFENLKGNMEESLNELKQVLPPEFEGAVRELIQSVREASSEEDLINIRGAIDNLIAQIEDPAVREAFKNAFGGLFDQVEQSTEMRVKKLADTIGSALTNAIKSIDKLLKTFEDNEINIIKDRIKAMKEAYDDLKEQMEKRNDKANGRLTRSQKDAIERQKKMDADELERQKALIEEQEDLLKDKQREQFERQKAFSIATATITGIQSAIDAYAGGMAMAKYMGMAAPAATGIAAALAAISMTATAAQIAAISNQQPPSYAQGAYNLPQDQLANVHKGEMIIPKPFAQEIRENGGLSGGEITINVYGATDEVSVEDNSSEGNQQLDIYLTQRVKTMVARGELDNALQTRYSISKNGRMS